jgi:medium-chain acyl-[acyl-carrier-protein] hydrolase
VCVPHAGAGVAPFRSWRDHLPGEIELCAVRFPGRESRIAEPLIDEMGALVSSLADAIEHSLATPFALLGMCSGAVVAFELARELRRRDEPGPAQLLVAAQRAPHLRAALGEGAADGLEPRERVHALGGTDPLVLEHPELMALLEPALQADFRLIDSYEYRPEAPLECPITAFAPGGDRYLEPAAVQAWSEETSAEFEHITLAGDHLFSGPAWRALAESVAASLVTAR